MDIMNYKITCVSGRYFRNKWSCEVAFKPEASLLDLHNAIQEIIFFDNDHLFDFFYANNPMGKRESIIDMKDWDFEVDPSEFKEILLSEIDLSYKKFFYNFDFGDNWLFQISQSKSKKEFDFKDIYHVFSSVGENPEQYPDYDDEDEDDNDDDE